MITMAIVAALIAAVILLFQKLLFYIERAICWVIGFLNDIFELVSGLGSVTYNGRGTRMINVFFGNSTVKTIYWGMALIGIVLCFGFTIIAVIRKASDSSDKVKQSMGDILTGTFKGILLILLMNFIMSATITVTSTLMDRINYLFLNAQSFNFDYTIYFDEEDYACMARSLNTIGNYSLNASYNSRYNLNSCYNDIRPDLKRLAEKGKFDTTYITTDYDENGNSYEKNTWQSVLQGIYRSVDDINAEQPLDEYNTNLSLALLDAMDVIRNDASFAALDSFKVHIQGSGFGETVPLDRLVMLIGSMYGDGDSLARGTGITDYLRGPYYYGQKDVFDYDQLTRDFDFSIGTWNHLTMIVIAVFFITQMLAMVFNATARIFNMLLLYLSAPPFFATMPLDDGGKTKQWTQAFVIQSLSLFGTLMSLRLVMLFIPILFSGDLHLFEGTRLDFFARVIVLIAVLFTARKASGMIVGILADNAGWQAINSGDLSNEASGALGKATGLAMAVPGAALAVGKAAVGAGKLGLWELGKEFGGKKDDKKKEEDDGDVLPQNKQGVLGNNSSKISNDPPSNEVSNTEQNENNNDTLPPNAPQLAQPDGGENASEKDTNPNSMSEQSSSPSFNSVKQDFEAGGVPEERPGTHSTANRPIPQTVREQVMGKGGAENHDRSGSIVHNAPINEPRPSNPVQGKPVQGKPLADSKRNINNNGK